MRKAVGNTWIFAIVLAFTLIFTGFLVLALAYSKSYKLKNEVSSIIERYEGLTATDSRNNLGSIGIINTYLVNSSYNAMGGCPAGSYGKSNLEDLVLTPAVPGNQYYYCIEYETDDKCYTNFRVTLFYKFNLPILGDMRQYAVSGLTNEIYKAYFYQNGANGEIPC